MGMLQSARMAGFLRSMTQYFVMVKMMAAKMAETPGAMSQAMNTAVTPLLISDDDDGIHWMPLPPRAAMPMPMTPPMMECVVDTGIPSRVARVRYSDEAMTAHIMPSMSTAGEALKLWVLTTLVRMVSATRAP